MALVGAWLKCLAESERLDCKERWCGLASLVLVHQKHEKKPYSHISFESHSIDSISAITPQSGVEFKASNAISRIPCSTDASSKTLAQQPETHAILGPQAWAAEATVPSRGLSVSSMKHNTSDAITLPMLYHQKRPLCWVVARWRGRSCGRLVKGCRSYISNLFLIQFPAPYDKDWGKHVKHQRISKTLLPEPAGFFKESPVRLQLLPLVVLWPIWNMTYHEVIQETV